MDCCRHERRQRARQQGFPRPFKESLPSSPSAKADPRRAGSPSFERSTSVLFDPSPWERRRQVRVESIDPLCLLSGPALGQALGGALAKATCCAVGGCRRASWAGTCAATAPSSKRSSPHTANPWSRHRRRGPRSRGRRSGAQGRWWGAGSRGRCWESSGTCTRPSQTDPTRNGQRVHVLTCAHSVQA